MALDLTGIDNVGEFYSHHYLDTLLEGDLKDALEGWKEAEEEGGPKHPEKRLAGLSKRYYEAVAEAAEGKSPLERWAPLRDFHAHLLEALGYQYKRDAVPLDDGAALPVLCTETRDGAPFLWIVDAPLPSGEDQSALDAQWLPEQLPGTPGDDAEAAEGLELPSDGDEVLTVSETLERVVFQQEAPPRWVLLLAGHDAFLIERAKFAQGRYLRFKLDDLYARKQTVALRAVVGLLHRDIVNPDDALCLHDTLDEASHRHAFAVSTDLKHGARRAIELIANEALRYRREVSKDKVFDLDEDLARELTQESLIYLYRLLFLFYVEARGGDLGVTPMQADAYRLGYSLETLRDLELVPLTTQKAQDGTFIHQSLERLFALVNRGFPTKRTAGQIEASDYAPGAFEHGAFTISGLRSALFDPERTPLLSKVKLRNVVLQEVIELLSLSKRSKRGRGRISYAQLGINQLGAVYEGLLAYRGFFADEDLFEVRAVKETQSEGRSFFVTKAELEEYDDDEVVKASDGTRARFTKGTYIFRLAGRDREKSASYYTPEVLTRCLTKYTLLERLKGLPADEILELTVLEPAMGSGAFLNEAVNQLADAYLERKQRELRSAAEALEDPDARAAALEAARIKPEHYALERQRVKAYITTRNVYGVDLNPLAAELGKISLWLNTLHEGARAPYLDPRIAIGNSLIGARREVFELEALDKRTKKDGRWTKRVPDPVPLGAARPKGTVYHFLLADEGMAPFEKDKVVKSLEPDAMKAIKDWRKAACDPYSAAEQKRLEAISDRIDTLWAEHAAARRGILDEVSPPLPVWGQPERPAGPYSAEASAELEQLRLGHPNAPGKRLAAVMDYWCALWSWPVSKADLLPSRSVWLDDVEAMLEDLTQARSRPTVAAAAEVAARARFHHWALRFPEVFAARGGFDIILGNPPWVKLQWNEQGVLGDFEPKLALRRLSAKQAADARTEVLLRPKARSAYFADFEELLGARAYVGAVQNEPVLQGIQANLYKVFLSAGWRLLRPQGTMGMFHQAGILEDAAGGSLRSSLFQRLCLVARFENQLKLFEEVHNRTQYVMTVTRGRPSAVKFSGLFNLYHPKTVEESLAHDGHGAVPGIKDDDGNWDLRGHRSRVIEVTEDTLALFASLYDKAGTPPLEARLPIVHSQEILRVLERFAQAPRKLADLGDDYFSTVCFDETYAQRDGTIRRETRVPEDGSELVLSGPHFYVATPFAKTPNEGCSHNKDYSVIDLTQIPEDYLPRTNYVPACDPAEYTRRTPHWRGKPVTEYFRHVNRQMVAPTGERTHVASIIPPGPAHVLTVVSTSFATLEQLLSFSAMSFSLPLDFYIKSSGRGHVLKEALEQFPLFDTAARLWPAALARVLRLVCVTRAFAGVWEQHYPRPEEAAPRTSDPRLAAWSSSKSGIWSRTAAARTAFDRRAMLLELDVLSAIQLGLDAEALCQAYRVQFPVLRQYDRETFYDQRGHIVFTINKGLPGVGLSRKEWEQVQNAQAGDNLPDFATEYVPPFDRRDREADMRQAYAFFAPLLEGRPAGSGRQQ